MKKQTLRHKIFEWIKSLFLGGLFTLLPIALTIALIAFTLRLIHSWFNPIYIIMPAKLKAIPYSEILVVIITIFVVGAIVQFFLLNRLIEAIEHHLLKKIPLIRPIYFGIKQLIKALNPQDKEHFQQVVLVEFPRSGVYSIGFLTSTVPAALSPCEQGKKGCKTYYSIFIPNTPNPTSGYYIIALEDECMITDLSRQEAMSIIISGGIIQPSRPEKTE